MAGRPVEQEFVAHLFAPLDGPAAPVALRQIRALWESCRVQLGMTQPILEAGLPGEIPDQPGNERDGALAGIQDPEINFQAIVRREHDVLNFSLVMATPVDPRRRRRFGLGTVAPPGWHEFERWWRKLTAGGTGALLGGATVYQGKARKPADADVRGALPVRGDESSGWWTRRGELEDFAVWEATVGGDRADRRLVVLARPDEDARLSTFTWSAGGTALPPFGRYLMHAAKVRYHARVLGDGSVLATVRDEVDRSLDHDDLAAAAAAEAALLGSAAAVDLMAHSVAVARENMAAALPGGPLPSDEVIAGWLTQNLTDWATVLEISRERAERVRTMIGGRWPAGDPAPVTTDPFAGAGFRDTPPADDGRTVQRLAFGVDVVGYSGRKVPQQQEVQQRLADIAERVLTGIGLRLHDTDRQDAGDGMMVVLPAGLEAHRVLPGLLHGWRKEVVADNAAHAADRVRLRLSVVEGPFTRAAIGFSGNTIIEAGRLLDSPPLRAAVVEHPDADLVVLVSDRLHSDVVVAGHEGLDAAQFERVVVQVKTFRKDAWLWLGVPVPSPPGTRPEEVPPPEREDEPQPASKPSGRDVFLIHGRDLQARDAVAGLLRDLDLRPLEWEDLVRRTGDLTPYVGQVLDQAFAENQAAIVLLTPEDSAALHESLGEDVRAGQSRPDVLFRAGMAMAKQRDRTVVVEIGDVRPIADLAGRQVVRVTAAPATQKVGKAQIAQLLRIAGCVVDTDGTDYLLVDHLAGLDAYDRRF